MSLRPARLAGLLTLLLVLLTVAAVVIPILVIRPFKAQTPEGIALAYTLRRWAPAGTLIAAAVVLALTVRLWRGVSRWSRTGLVLALLLIAAASWSARQNIFERMFAPLATTQLASATEADWVDPGDMVLAVDVGGEAVAYPVRQVSYHHVVQDVVGGVPIAATY
jgi:Protein of unknown function (DUF3179)